MEYVFTTDNFEKEVLQSETPVMVDFFATWCGPCSMMAPAVLELANEYDGKVKVGKLDIDNSMDIARKYRVMSVPTFIFFKDGKIVDQTMGAVGKEALENKIKGLL